MPRLKTGDLLVVTTSEGTAQLAVLHVCDDGKFQLGDDPDYGVPFAPLPYIFEVPTGVELVGGPEPMPIISVLRNGGIEAAAHYNDLMMRKAEAEKSEPSDEEYNKVVELNQETSDLVAALTLYPGFMQDGTAQAVAVLTAIGIPIPDREKLILLGMAFDNLYLNTLEETLPEDDKVAEEGGEDEASGD